MMWYSGQRVVCIMQFQTIATNGFVCKKPISDGGVYTVKIVMKHNASGAIGLIIHNHWETTPPSDQAFIYASYGFMPLGLWSANAKAADKLLHELGINL